MELAEFVAEFQDYLAPKLDTYEQVIYLYIFRHSRLLGIDEVTIGFKSARRRMALGIGEKGKPMSEGTCYGKLRSLARKGCLEITGSHRDGTRLRLRLPSEIEGIRPSPAESVQIPLEEMDFFTDRENRELILQREGHRCFYCLRELTSDNYVVEHVASRPERNNTYRNVVAGCRACNNRKGASAAEDFLRLLYREGYHSSQEFEDRLGHLAKLRSGQLIPKLPGG